MDKRRGLTLSIEDTATAATSEKSVKRPSIRSISLSKRASPRHARRIPYGGPLYDVDPRPPQTPKTTQNAATNSTATLCEDSTISHDFNSRAMLVSFAQTFDVEKVMRKIFPRRTRLTSPRAALKPILSPKSLFDASKRSHSRGTDSVFTKEEADLILAETVHNTRAIQNAKWSEFMCAMKNHPKLLMSLVPLSVQSQKSPRRLSLNRSSLLHRGKTPISPLAQGQRQQSPRATQRSRRQSTPQCSITASLTEDEVESLRTKEDEHLTEDWSKSILYRQVKTGREVFNGEKNSALFTEEELTAINLAPSDIEDCYQKALRTLEQLLVEMLGTREDAERFQEKYAKCTMRSVKHLVTKCQEILHLRTVLCRLLLAVRQREKDFRDAIKCTDTQSLKNRVTALFRQGKTVQAQVADWLQLDPPFSCFMFRGQNYLDRVVEQNLTVLLLLSKTVI